VAVHEAALGGQRVQADHRRDRGPVERQGELADELEPVRRVQHHVAALRRQDGVRADLGHGCAP
jgi:hypothetical protein